MTGQTKMSRLFERQTPLSDKRAPADALPDIPFTIYSTGPCYTHNPLALLNKGTQ